MKAADHHAARGFTLIEVLVALMIVALGMGAVLSSLSSAADSTIRLREKSFASWVGLNQLTETRLKFGPTAKGKTTGEVEFANAHWYWQQQVESTQIPGIDRITIQVRHDVTPDLAQRNATAAPTDWVATVVGFRGAAVASPLSVLQPFP